MSVAICAFPGNEPFAGLLRSHLGAEPVGLELRRFPDGESYVRFESACNGRDLALVCTLNDPDPKALGLLFAARTAHELGAASVGLVAPYLAYMRQDRRFREGEAVNSTLFAALLSSAFDWLVTVDPHLHRTSSLAEIYAVPARAVPAAPGLTAWIAANVERPLVIGPDAESEQWAAEVAVGAGAPYALLSKIRRGDREVEVRAPSLERWRGHTPVLIDDIISSARTMVAAARLLMERDMPAPVCVGVHGIFSSDALDALRAAGVTRIATTNTIQNETTVIDISAAVAQAVEAAVKNHAERRKGQ